VKRIVQFFPSGHVRLLSGLCLTDARCGRRALADLKVRLQSLHGSFPSIKVTVNDLGFSRLAAKGFLCAQLAI
jgi:hypothetical protein